MSGKFAADVAIGTRAKSKRTGGASRPDADKPQGTGHAPERMRPTPSSPLADRRLQRRHDPLDGQRRVTASLNNVVHYSLLRSAVSWWLLPAWPSRSAPCGEPIGLVRARPRAGISRELSISATSSSAGIRVSIPLNFVPFGTEWRCSPTTDAHRRRRGILRRMFVDRSDAPPDCRCTRRLRSTLAECRADRSLRRSAATMYRPPGICIAAITHAHVSAISRRRNVIAITA